MRSKADAGRGPGLHSLRLALSWQDGFAAGNGWHGALAWGEPRDEQAVVTHHALVLPNSGTGRLPPRLAGQLPALRALLLAGESAEALRRSCEGWQEWFPRSFHPALAVTLRATGRGEVTGPAGRGEITGYRRALDFRTGLMSTSWQDGAGRWRRYCFVSRARDVVVLGLALPRDAPACVEVSHQIRLPGAPPDLDVRWAEPVPAELGSTVSVRVGYPDPVRGRPGQAGGRVGQAGGYAVATRIVAAGGDCETDGPLTRIHGAREVMLLIKVCADPAAATPPGPPVACSGPAVACPGPTVAGLAGLPADFGALLTEHARVHRACAGDVRLDLGASQRDRDLPVEDLLARQAAEPGRPLPALLEKLFDSGRYLLLSASGLLPPRLPGLWQGDWHAAWSGAIVSNANLNLQLAGAVTTHVPATVHALARMVAAHLPDWRLNAARLYGAGGVLAPASSDGFSGAACHFGPSYPHHLWTAGADWLAVTLLDYADATGDEAFLRAHVLPLLTGIAAFYEDFLAGPGNGAGGAGAGGAIAGSGVVAASGLGGGTGAGGDRAAVTFVPSYSPENRPGGWEAAAVNATMDIAAARHALTAAAEVCTRLGLEQGPGQGAQRWLALRDRLPAYRVNGDGALAEWAWPPSGPPLPDSYDHRHLSHLYPVWPLHDIAPGPTRPQAEGPAAKAALAEAALRALRLRGRQDGSAHGLLHACLAAARLRDAELAGQRLAALTGGGYFFGGLMSGHYPGPDVYNADAACCLPGLLAELLVDSTPPVPAPAPATGPATAGATSAADPAAAPRPGRVELLPAVPRYLPAGRVTGLRTRAGVVVSLAWDRPAGRASVLLHSGRDQQVDVVCRGAREFACGAVMSQISEHEWRLRLTAGTTTYAEMEVLA